MKGGGKRMGTGEGISAYYFKNFLPYLTINHPYSGSTPCPEGVSNKEENLLIHS